MANPKTVQFEFEDLSPKNSISYSPASEKAVFDVVNQDDGIAIYANRDGFLHLAQICSILGTSDYTNGFHIHLRKDFSDEADQPDLLNLTVWNPE